MLPFNVRGEKIPRRSIETGRYNDKQFNEIPIGNKYREQSVVKKNYSDLANTRNSHYFPYVSTSTLR